MDEWITNLQVAADATRRPADDSMSARMAVSVEPQAPVVDPETHHDPSTGDGDHDRFAHYVTEQELKRSKRTGKPVTALCGKKWKPSADPSKYPMCPTCAEIAADLMANELRG